MMPVRIILVLLLLAGTAFAQHSEDAFVGQNAPAFKEATAWINTKPLTLEGLRGKVVLINFWAFDCPFCAEALPHIKEMHEKFGKDGLVVIGVHVPRVEYEKDVAKIRDAVKKKGIEYPVVVDNEYKIWGDYLGNVWPSHFVVDQKGVIQLSHSGNGRHEETAKLIQQLLGKK